jgi:hypothetical protein
MSTNQQTAGNAAAAAGMQTGLSLLLKRLAEPFAPQDVSWKPQAVKGNRALAIAYTTVRAVMDRLDEVLGPDGWEDRYELLPDNSVVCKLTVRSNGAKITKCDVGSPSEQPDGGDRLKAAFSDALKRAAVKFGIGRYLYRLPLNWVDYDTQKKQFVSRPNLPDWALPNGSGRPGPTSHVRGQNGQPQNNGQSGQGTGMKISGQQAAEINAKLAMCQGNAKTLCEYFKVRQVADLPQSAYSDIVESLNRRIKAMERVPEDSGDSGEVPY